MLGVSFYGQVVVWLHKHQVFIPFSIVTLDIRASIYLRFSSKEDQSWTSGIGFLS